MSRSTSPLLATGNTSADAGQLVYQGAGFVVVHPDSQGINFSIRSATLVLKDKRGDIPDPLGKAAVTGDFYAWRNPSIVDTTPQMSPFFMIEKMYSLPSAVKVVERRPPLEVHLMRSLLSPKKRSIKHAVSGLA